MIKLLAKVREHKDAEDLRKKGILPGVLYGPKIKPVSVEIDAKEFKKIYQKAGESSLISLEVADSKEYLVLIHELQIHPLTGGFIHVDFYQPILTEEVEVTIPIVFEGESLAVKDLGGTLVKEIKEVAIKALPQNLPHEIIVNIEGLKTFEDEILVKDLKVPQGVKILKEPDDIVAVIAQITNVEEELEKPIEEKVEEVETVEKKEGEEEPAVEEQPPIEEKK